MVSNSELFMKTLFHYILRHSFDVSLIIAFIYFFFDKVLGENIVYILLIGFLLEVFYRLICGMSKYYKK